MGDICALSWAHALVEYQVLEPSITLEEHVRGSLKIFLRLLDS